MLPRAYFIIPLIILAVFSNCSLNHYEKLPEAENIVQTQMKGKIIAETFVNKGGKEISTIKDLFFQTISKKYFIKFMDSNITFDEAKDLIDKEITIEGTIKDGLWDVPDDNPQYAQSRGGLYLIIHKIIP